MLQNSRHELEDLARQLEATGDYRVLRRLVPQQPAPTQAGSTDKIGIILDVETTGLEYTRDEIIELGMVKFRYSAQDELIGVSETFQSLHQLSIPIPAEITELTMITDEMVTGQAIDPTAIGTFVADARHSMSSIAYLANGTAIRQSRSNHGPPTAYCRSIGQRHRSHGTRHRRLYEHA